MMSWKKQTIVVVMVAILTSQVSSDCVGRRVRRQDSETDDSNVIHFSIECPMGARAAAQAQASNPQPAVLAPPRAAVQNPEFITGMAKEGIKLAEETPKTVLDLLEPFKKLKLPKIERRPLKDVLGDIKPEPIKAEAFEPVNIEPAASESTGEGILVGTQRAAAGFFDKLKDKKDFLRNALAKKTDDVVEKEQEAAESVHEPSLVPLIKHIDNKAQELKKDVIRNAAEVKQKIMDERKQKEEIQDLQPAASEETSPLDKVSTLSKKPLFLKNDKLRSLLSKTNVAAEPIRDKQEVSASKDEPSIAPLIKHIDERTQELKSDLMKKAAEVKQKIIDERRQKEESQDLQPAASEEIYPLNKISALSKKPLFIKNDKLRSLLFKTEEAAEPEVSASAQKPNLIPLIKQIDEKATLLKKDILQKTANARKIPMARSFLPEIKETADDTAKDVINKADSLIQVPLTLNEKLLKALEVNLPQINRPASSRPLALRQAGAESRLVEQNLPAPREAKKVVELNHYELAKNGCDVCSCLMKNMPKENDDLISPRQGLLKTKRPLIKSPFLNALRARSNILQSNDDLSFMSDTSNPVFALPPPGMTSDGIKDQVSEADSTPGEAKNTQTSLDNIIEQEEDLEEDAGESAANRIDRLDAGITNLMDFVKIVDQVDRYVSDKTKQVITTLSKMYQEDGRQRR